MKKYYVLYVKKDGKVIPVDYTDVESEEDIGKYGGASFDSFMYNKFKDVPEDKQEEAINEFVEDAEFMISENKLDLILPEWCKETQGNYDQVAYLVVDNRKSDEDAFVGLYASEYEAWNKTHDMIASEDLELFTPSPIYYVRLFKLTVKNVMPVGDDVYVKYNYETMQFDI